MSKMSQYALDQQDKAYQRGEQEKDFSNLRPDEVAELNKWLDKMNETSKDDNHIAYSNDKEERQ